MKTENRTALKMLVIGALVVVVIALSLSSVDAYRRLCMGYGEQTPVSDPRFTCYHDQCLVCVTDAGYPAHPGQCNSIVGCEYSGNESVDLEPPEFEVFSPVNDHVYKERRVLFDMETNEPVSFYWKDNNEPQKGWRRLTSGETSYSREINLNEGANDILFKAIDRRGNEAVERRTFAVDSKVPVIRSTSPTSGFIGSVFDVEYDEDNVAEVVLHYGNTITGMRSLTKTDCPSGTRQMCSIDVDLQDYDGQSLRYWFVVSDIAGSSDISRERELMVDESPPEIVSVEHTVDGRNVFFEVTFIEPFFDELTYIDTSDPRARERTLCRRADGGVCTKRLSFKDGSHDVMIYLRDNAGNEDSALVSFYTDSKKPRITKTSPTRGFASGVFMAEFVEENPSSLVLNYGNDALGFNAMSVDLGGCTPDRRGVICGELVDLTAFNGGRISYWFELTDIVGHTDTSREYTLLVDTVDPVLNSLTYDIKGRRVSFMFDVTELNFDEIQYRDLTDRTPRLRRLCSRLNDEGICETRKSFSKGHHIVDILVLDKAGNSVESQIEFTIL